MQISDYLRILMGKAAAHKRLTALLILTALLLSWYLLCLPRELFPDTVYSTVVTDRNGELLGARIASDGQWRFGAGSYSDEDGRDKYFTSLIELRTGGSGGIPASIRSPSASHRMPI